MVIVVVAPIDDARRIDAGVFRRYADLLEDAGQQLRRRLVEIDARRLRHAP